jgi:hypothetical protein
MSQERFSGKATTRDLAIPDVTEGVAQDRRRQEPRADFKVEE